MVIQVKLPMAVLTVVALLCYLANLLAVGLRSTTREARHHPSEAFRPLLAREQAGAKHAREMCYPR